MPVTATTALVIAAGATAGVSAYSIYQQGKSTDKMNKFNAEVAARDAENKKKAGAAQKEEVQDRTRRVLSSLRASNAKSGFTTQGTPLLVQLEQAELGALDAETTEYNTRIGVQKSLSERALYKLQGASARRQGNLGAGQALLKGGTDIASIKANA